MNALDKIQKIERGKNLFLCALSFGILLFFILLLPRLSEGTLWHTDEAYTAERSREMLVLKDYSMVYLYFKPSFNKPPLQYFLTTLSMRLIQDPELSVRIWSLLYGAGCLVITAFLYLELRPEKYFEAFAASFFVATYPHFVDNAKIGLLDMGALFYLLLTFLSILKAVQGDAKGWLIAGIAAGLGCWQKNALSLIALLSVSLFLASWKEWRALIWHRPWFIGIFLALGIGLSWPIAQFVLHPALYLEALQNDWRHLTTKDAFIDPSDYFLYLKWMARKWGPWSFAVLSAWIGFFVSQEMRKRRDLIAMVLFSAGYILVISLFQFKRNYYILPIIPLLSVLTVYFYSTIWPKRAALLFAACGIGTLLFSIYHYTRPSKDYAAQVELIRRAERLTYLSDVLNHHEALAFICKDKHFESIESLFPAFVMYYGKLDRPVDAHTVRSLARLPADTPIVGVLYIEVSQEVSSLLTNYQEIARKGDYILFRGYR